MFHNADSAEVERVRKERGAQRANLELPELAFYHAIQPLGDDDSRDFLKKNYEALNSKMRRLGKIIRSCGTPT